MHASHITISHQTEVSSTQSSDTPTTHGTTEAYTPKPSVNQNQIFVSKVSRVLSLDSSIPTLPSMNTSSVMPFVPVHNVVTSSSKSYMPSTQQIEEEKSISRKSSGASSDLYFPGDLGHNGKEDKLPLRSGLKDPIWVTPRICTHQGINGEMCFMCRKDLCNGSEKPECRPDFTVLNVYGTRRPAKKKCRCGTTTTLTVCFSVFVLTFILAFVIYNECVLKRTSPIIVHYKM
ncbi:unnamed protein product [Meganyctiphanes norvegica]|uniref:Uncharacterized protein n=1 Tax=Meganyctiphanes norvegica TaxID=48144 RepID=A0AAV2QWD2_MEGNR